MFSSILHAFLRDEQYTLVPEKKNTLFQTWKGEIKYL